MGLSLLFVSLLAASVEASVGHGSWHRVSQEHQTFNFGVGNYSCKCYSSDNCWPLPNIWAKLNTTIGGNLLPVLPLGHQCFKSFENKTKYDAEACVAAQKNNLNASYVVSDPVQAMYMYWSNNTCDPSADQQHNECRIGYYPEYVITAKTKEHIQAGVNFAREHNLRLVIRNTGHDFLGRSIGRGSLAINTHSFRNIEFMEKYTGPGNWRGATVTVGAGVMFKDLYPKAFERKVVVVGGECLTVGFTGGYIQGGGQGPLSGIHGMAADNVLSFDVVTADGEFVTADATCNSDLFWALRGGGPSTFGVVTSMTVKTHPEIKTIGMTLTFTGRGDTFWNGIKDFYSMANTWANAGIYVWFSYFSGQMNIQPLVAPNITLTQFLELVNPFFAKLQEHNIIFKHTIYEFDSFYELYDQLFEKTHDAGGNQIIVGGRVFTQQDMEENLDDIVSALRFAVDSGAIYGGHILNPGHGVSLQDADVPVHPAWRKAASQDVFFLPLKNKLTLKDRREAEHKVTNIYGKRIREASPRSASYVNEGDANEPDWQNTYWGAEHYAKLLLIKKKWDPKGVFYAKLTPGTEAWEESDGKLCKML
ncbi:FAD binding domain-containing protein [Delitschia confertaspora ATCC 74209]|uniref:FAD binding domain-containing protein n=1 Tax=Delitschia confertaspora ATCC 74209 TaxID=1513339 RepID=A0A9P4MKP6_9PLEO|nr:FAD binding domain-containing protein [Delitschia confertaspora ATCC 74209]